MRQLIGTKKWLEKISDDGRSRLRQDREMRDEIIVDDSFESELDRLVLGMTGSVVQLRQYQLLAEKVGHSTGKPIITVDEESQRHEKVIHASGGIVAGQVEADLSFHPTEPNDRRKPRVERAELWVPVRPLGYFSGNAFRDSDRAFLVRDLDGSDSGDTRKLRIAHFQLLERANETYDANNDWHQAIKPENILIGRPEIYKHPYFAKGIHRLMELLEEYTPPVAEESLST
jgi:hypothetical protein